VSNSTPVPPPGRHREVLHLRVAAGEPVVAELVALQHESYAVEAALIGSDAIPPLQDTPITLVAAGLTWFGLRDGAGLLGAVAVGDGPGGTEVDRLVVAPRAFRRGVGSALVRYVLGRAGGRAVTVSTGRANAPARALYTRLGFAVTGESEVEPGLWVVHMASGPPG
jgi:ribosomal protein S18 acetylase RimI-like enzyme